MDIRAAYKLLDLSPGADIAQVRAAHRKLIANWHPDKCKSDNEKSELSEGMSKDINSARDCLVAHIAEFEDKGQPIAFGKINNPKLRHFSYFVSDVFVEDQTKGIALEDLYSIYRIWCSAKKLKEFSLQELMIGMKDLGCNHIHHDSDSYFQSKYFKGLTLKGEWYQKIYVDDFSGYQELDKSW